MIGPKILSYLVNRYTLSFITKNIVIIDSSDFVESLRGFTQINISTYSSGLGDTRIGKSPLKTESFDGM